MWIYAWTLKSLHELLGLSKGCFYLKTKYKSYYSWKIWRYWENNLLLLFLHVSFARITKGKCKRKIIGLVGAICPFGGSQRSPLEKCLLVWRSPSFPRLFLPFFFMSLYLIFCPRLFFKMVQLCKVWTSFHTPCVHILSNWPMCLILLNTSLFSPQKSCCRWAMDSEMVYLSCCSTELHGNVPSSVPKTEH